MTPPFWFMLTNFVVGLSLPKNSVPDENADTFLAPTLMWEFEFFKFKESYWLSDSSSFLRAKSLPPFWDWPRLSI